MLGLELFLRPFMAMLHHARGTGVVGLPVMQTHIHQGPALPGSYLFTTMATGAQLKLSQCPKFQHQIISCSHSDTVFCSAADMVLPFGDGRQSAHLCVVRYHTCQSHQVIVKYGPVLA